MKIYKPMMKNNNIVKFNKEQLEELLEKLEQSKAQEIGIELQEE